MFYCKNCKSKSEGPVCQTCGTPFTRADEIVNCPNCNKMFFKPDYDFKCTKCGTLVPVVSTGAEQQNVGYNNMQGMPQNNMYGAQNMQGGIVPPNMQGSQGMYNQMPNPNAGQNNMNGMYQNQQNNMAGQGVVSPNMGNAQNMQQNPYQQQNGYANMNQNAYNQNANMMGAQNQQMQQTESNYQSANQTTSTDDFLSLFASNDMQSEEGDHNEEGEMDFESLRSEEKSVSEEQVIDEGKTYDENGYEIVDASASPKSNKSKKKKGGAAKEYKESAGKGIKAFAWTEFVLLIACLAFIGYLMLGQYITTPDPCQRAWTEYTKAQTVANGTEFSDAEKIVSQVEITEDGLFAVYKVTEKSVWVVFSIEKGLSISNFFNMSKATVVAEYNNEPNAVAKMNQLATENA